jgi:hypothetical protein
MDIQRKLKLFKSMGRIFPEWALVLQARAIERAYDSDISQAKSYNDRQSLIAERQSEAGSYWLELDQLRSWKLVRKARKMFIDTTDLKWEHDHNGNRSLTEESQSKLVDLVKKERRDAWEFRIKIILTVTTLVATITSLVLALRK